MTAISNFASLPGNMVSISYILILFLFIYFTHIRLIEFVFFVVFSFLFIYFKQNSIFVLVKNFF